MSNDKKRSNVRNGNCFFVVNVFPNRLYKGKRVITKMESTQDFSVLPNLLDEI